MSKKKIVAIIGIIVVVGAIALAGIMHFKNNNNNKADNKTYTQADGENNTDASKENEKSEENQSKKDAENSTQSNNTENKEADTSAVNEKGIKDTVKADDGKISKDKCIDLAMAKVQDLYSQEGATELLKEANAKLIPTEIKDEEIQGKEGFLVSIAEKYPDKEIITSRCFVDKNTGEVLNAFNYVVLKDQDNPLKPF